MVQNIHVKSTGELSFDEKAYRCSLGKNGLTGEKKEGDLATPLGCFPIRRVWYRADRTEVPETIFETRELTEKDAWCTKPESEKYNQHIVCEKGTGSLWREDHLFDILVELGYNDDPVVSGAGSAIFIHLAREGYTPTAGCVGLSKEDILLVLKKAERNTQVCIKK